MKEPNPNQFVEKDAFKRFMLSNNSQERQMSLVRLLNSDILDFRTKLNSKGALRSTTKFTRFREENIEN